MKGTWAKQCRHRSDATNVASDHGLHCLPDMLDFFITEKKRTVKINLTSLKLEMDLSKELVRRVHLSSMG